MKIQITLFYTIFALIINHSCKPVVQSDMSLINGKVITVDSRFTIEEAVAIKGDTILALGTTGEINKFTGNKTQIIDLKGQTVIPGLIDSHLHPEPASLSEIDEEIPDVHTIDQLLEWIRNESSLKKNGEWIIFPKFFSTRLTEMRQPSLKELDVSAPENPVFLNGSFGGMINSEAMRISGISAGSDHPGIIKDPATGSPTGFIRASAFNLLKIPSQKPLSYLQIKKALKEMISRYNRYCITGLFSGTGDFESIKLYQDLASDNELTARIYQNILMKTPDKITKESIDKILNSYPGKTGSGDKWVRTGSLKVFMDGGILTGTAYLQEPWGEKAGEIFGIDDPSYRGIINFTRDDLITIVSAANEYNWSFTAHATGDGSVNMLLDVYDEVNKSKSITERRFSIIHGNFFSHDAIKKMAELGVYANVQPAWFYKDADAMLSILGNERIKSFHPNKAMIDAGVIINGGSDHMVKWDADASINPYNPFLAMWSIITRKTERSSTILPDEAVSREEALRIYTINNAYASFEESIKGSIEPGKLADMAIITDDFLTCPVDKIKGIESLITIVGGKIVYRSEFFK
ncbi:MAG TPA: amidohydrolase [Bacteroidales bacterium]|nr:amidohydrolase [Bacteroidales bacterium]